MISSLADHGHVEEAVSLFAKMEESSFRQDNLSFSAILYACSHIGFVDAGYEYFQKMASIYDIRPTIEHYGCMVDMFGRARELEEAYDIIRSMPIEPNSVILRSFISVFLPKEAVEGSGSNVSVYANRRGNSNQRNEGIVTFQRRETTINIGGK
ncbi:hypothetical protein RDI58_000830 [Solanum bulbocastanum]|uniref:Pentatricopeptide repeat-containing protein n=1 Tax=Solanum bulbocastanum TaxID=147425 RepID=A0AAN8UD40_SOLBU